VRGALLAAFVWGCAGPMEVVKTTTPDEASQANGTRLHAVAIVRGQARAPLPADVAIADNEARVPRPGIFKYTLDPGETVVRDEQKRVVGVKSTEGHVTAFIPGTASVSDAEVSGELVDHVEHVALLPGDRIELRGTFAPGETVPTGGKIAVTRIWSALGFGGALLFGAWIPSIVVAATSSIDANHWLYVPAIGPWIDYATRAACTPSVDPRPCLNDAAEQVGIIADGILQTTGAVLMVLGIPSTAEVRWGKDARARIGPSWSASSRVAAPPT
jgi:hypothetical protein